MRADGSGKEWSVAKVDPGALAADLLSAGEEVLGAVRVNWNGMVPHTQLSTTQALAEQRPDGPDPDTLVTFPSAKQLALVLTGGRLLVWSLGFSGKPKQFLGEVPLSAISEVHYGQVSFGGLIRVVMASTAVVDLEVMRGEPGDQFFEQLQHLVNDR